MPTIYRHNEAPEPSYGEGELDQIESRAEQASADYAALIYAKTAIRDHWQTPDIAACHVAHAAKRLSGDARKALNAIAERLSEIETAEDAEFMVHDWIAGDITDAEEAMDAADDSGVRWERAKPFPPLLVSSVAAILAFAA